MRIAVAAVDLAEKLKCLQNKETAVQEYSQLAMNRWQVCSSRGNRARCMEQAAVRETLQTLDITLLVCSYWHSPAPRHHNPIRLCVTDWRPAFDLHHSCSINHWKFDHLPFPLLWIRLERSWKVCLLELETNNEGLTSYLMHSQRLVSIDF